MKITLRLRKMETSEVTDRDIRKRSRETMKMLRIKRKRLDIPLPAKVCFLFLSIVVFILGVKELSQVASAHEIVKDLPISTLVEEIPEPIWGADHVTVDDIHLVRYSLPDEYYKNLDYWSFQPYMCYMAITSRNSRQWKIVRSEQAYTDENGFRRHKTKEEDFTVEGEDDYIIALGNFYKAKGEVGGRYLVITETGMYTAMVGDEKADIHTDQYHMFSWHGKDGRRLAGVIEWIIDTTKNPPKEVIGSGTGTSAPISALQGKLKYIYRII